MPFLIVSAFQHFIPAQTFCLQHQFWENFPRIEKQRVEFIFYNVVFLYNEKAQNNT